MQKLDPTYDIEKALARLMPTALSESASKEINGLIDELAGEENYNSPTKYKWPAIVGIAAAIAFGIFVFKATPNIAPALTSTKNIQTEEASPTMSFLSETDRVENMKDEGLFVDAGGSAVRKVRVRVVEESQIRDEETGIVMMLTEPREELYMVPVSTF